MYAEKLNPLLSLIANIGILIGLLLVIFQMQQNEHLMRLDILNQIYEGYVAAETEIGGDEIAHIWEKTVVNPGDLSLAEMRAMESQLFAPLLRFINYYHMYEEGLIDSGEWQSQVYADSQFYYGYAYGAAWWDTFSEGVEEDYLPAELKQFIDATLQTIPKNATLEYFENIKSRALERLAAGK